MYVFFKIVIKYKCYVFEYRVYLERLNIVISFFFNFLFVLNFLENRMILAICLLFGLDMVIGRNNCFKLFGNF